MALGMVVRGSGALTAWKGLWATTWHARQWRSHVPGPLAHVHGEGGTEARNVRPQQGGLAMGQAYLPAVMRCDALR